MLLPLYLGVLHAVEPDHVAVVTGISLSGKRGGAWKVGLAFGLSHMLAVALLAVATTLIGQATLGDGFFLWMDRMAWALVLLLGFWNLAGALGFRTISPHSHAHRHGPLVHAHPHPHRHRPARITLKRVTAGRASKASARRTTTVGVNPLDPSGGPHAPGDSTHAFHHSAAWLGAFFGLGGVRGFTTLMHDAGITGKLQFLEALLLFGLGITAMFIALSAISGAVIARLGDQLRFRRGLFALSGVGNVGVGLYLLLKG